MTPSQNRRDSDLDQMSRRVRGQDQSTGSGRVRATVRRLRPNLREDADHPVYISTKRHVGYWMEM